MVNKTKSKNIKNRKTRKDKKTRKGRKQKGRGTISSHEVEDPFKDFLKKREDLTNKDMEEQLREFIKHLYISGHIKQANAFKIVYNKTFDDYDAETQLRTPPRNIKPIKEITPGKMERGESPRPSHNVKYFKPLPFPDM